MCIYILYGLREEVFVPCKVIPLIIVTKKFHLREEVFVLKVPCKVIPLKCT